MDKINAKGATEDGEILILFDDSSPGKGDEEDIPDDFFDDFSNQDFMDGLDIVDAWDEKEKNKRIKEHTEREERRRQRKRSRDKGRSADRDRRRRSEERRRRSKERKPKQDSPVEKSSKNESDLRRDPSKAKRDMERDRENYAKKKEQKLISKVVETGLVPPGMESEFNLSEIEEKEKLSTEDVSKDKRRKDSPKRDEMKLSKERRSRERSRSRERRERRRRSRSFNRASPIYSNRLRARSIERRRERSNERRERSNERRERSIDRMRERIDRSRERRRTRSRDRSLGRIRGPSPVRRKRRSRSISDRERWLQQRRSPSPERKYKDRITEDKLSFLEEIKMKLDGIPQKPAGFSYPQPTPLAPTFNAAPVPVPTAFPPTPYITPHNQFFPQMQNSPYDQSFFIGDGQPTPPALPDPMNGCPPVPVLRIAPQATGPVPVLRIAPQATGVPPMANYMGIPETTQRHVPVPPPNSSQVVAPGRVNDVSKLMEQIRAATNSKVNQTGNAAQLLEEKKLSLTDYLSLSSRPPAYSSSPESLQKKVNVLSRCQDILKELSGDKKLGGKLVVAKCSKAPLNTQGKDASPLLRKQAVRFAYPSANRNQDKASYQKILNKALLRAKVLPEIIDLVEEEEESEALPPAPPIGKQRNNSFVGAGPKHPEPPIKDVLMKMCQTDPVHCEDCQKRKAVQYKSIGVQCGETDRFNVGIQVVEADIIDANIPKNQSLAYLTPAQLLGRGDPTSTKVDQFGSFGRQALQHFRGDVPDFRDWPRNYTEADLRRANYPPSPPYPGNAMRDVRFPRY